MRLLRSSNEDLTILSELPPSGIAGRQTEYDSFMEVAFTMTQSRLDEAFREKRRSTYMQMLVVLIALTPGTAIP